MITVQIKHPLRGASGKMVLDIHFKIKENELVTLYGKSGAGKTTTLRILAGLMRPKEGKIVVNDKVWLDTKQGIFKKPQERRVGLLFQDYALFPNMTVRQNLEFALLKNQPKTIVSDLIEIMEIGELQHQKPQHLSGGQQQRVALARALVQKPKLLLLDEPLSALDITIRQKLQSYILQVHKEFNLTTILISHDISEILRLSDTILELENGAIIAQTSRTDFLNHKNFGFDINLDGIIIQKNNQKLEVTLQIGDNQVATRVNQEYFNHLKIGDKVQFSSKLFMPLLRKK